MSKSTAAALRRSFVALSCIAPAFAPIAAAQSGTAGAEQERSLGSVTVTDTAIDDQSYKTEDAASIKITAPLLDTPRTISVIPHQLISDTQSTTLVEALRTVPGITFGGAEGGNSLGDRPFLRGNDAQNSLFVDGVRSLGASTRELFAIDRIEVVKGSDGVINGSGNAGGSINQITKQPLVDRAIRAEGSYGNADYKRATVDINLPLNDFVGVRLNAMYHDQNVAGRDATFQKRWGVAPSIKLGLNGPTSLTIDYYHLHTRELPDAGIPYFYTINNQPTANFETPPLPRSYTALNGVQVEVPRDAFYGIVGRDFRRTNNNEASARIVHEFDSGVTLRNTSRYTHSTQEYLWTQPDDSQGNAANTGTIWRRINQRYSYYESITNQTDLSGKFETGSLRHSFALALEYNWQNAATGSFVSNAATGTAVATGSTLTPRCQPINFTRYNCTTVAAPNPDDPWVSYASDTSNVVVPIVRSAPKTRTLTHATSYSVGAYDTITITDSLLLNLGGRYDRVSTNVSAGVPVTTNAARVWLNKKNDLWTYQAGLVFKPASTVSLYVSTSRAAVPPGSFLAQGTEDNAISSTAAISLNDLKVQKTTSYEAGAKASLFGEALSLTAAVFQTKTSNARTANPDGTLSYVGTRRIRGFEIGYAGNITEEWNVFGGFVYMPSKVTNAGVTATTLNGVTQFAPAAATGHPFPNTVKTSFTAFTNYKVTPEFTIGGGAIYMGKVYGGFSDARTIQNGAVVITKTRATYVPSYWRFDANASYQITDQIGVRVNALNLTNKRYFDQTFVTHYAHQAAGRTVIGTVSFAF